MGGGGGGGGREENMQCATLTDLLETTRMVERHSKDFNLCSTGAFTQLQPWPMLSRNGQETAEASCTPWPGSRDALLQDGAGCFPGLDCRGQCPSRQSS